MRNLHSIILCLAAALPLLVASCSHSDPRTQALIDLRDDVEDHIENLQPGDWIVIGPTEVIRQAVKLPEADSVSVLASNVGTLRETLDLMESEERLSARIWVCRELESPANRRKPGNARLRSHLRELLSGRPHFSVEERVIAMQLGMLQPPRRVLFVHTDTTLPHSTIGLELDYAGRTAVPVKPQPQNTPYRHAELKP